MWQSLKNFVTSMLKRSGKKGFELSPPPERLGLYLLFIQQLDTIDATTPLHTATANVLICSKSISDNHLFSGGKIKCNPKAITIADEAQAIDHVVYYHKLFRPDILKACKELRDIKAQAMKLVLALDNIPDARLYESAVATDISVSKLERFQLTYPKKSA